MSKAFTLIELLVVVSIIVLMTAITLPSYRSGENQLALQRSAHKLSQDLRRAQEFAISVKDFNGSVPAGYGIYFDLDQPDRYIMFADLDGDQAYSGSNEKVEEIIFEDEAAMSFLNPVSPESSLTVFFAPPDPEVTITPAAGSAVVTLGKEEKNYTYNFVSKTYAQPSARASCDVNPDTQDCPSSFAAPADGLAYVYDWFTEEGTAYEYRWVEDVAGYQTPRASCDISSSLKECASTFPAVFDSAPFIYDQFKGEPYQYVYNFSTGGHVSPRATHCDLNDSVRDCYSVSPFGDIYGGSINPNVYDWWKVVGTIKRSDRYTRQLTNNSQKFQKVSFSQDHYYSNRYKKTETTTNVLTVSINSAGLIAVE